jgi:DNA-binding PadR family transcriptional regulator
MAAPLTTTSYAILGLLAVKPWTTYELAQQMQRALGQFWPRAESKLYEEPKKLVAHGLARASSEMVGKRPRTVYTITPKGRRALAAWVPTPGDGPTLEFEQLVKVFFAEHAKVGRRSVRRDQRHLAGLPGRTRTVPGSASMAHSRWAVFGGVHARGRAVGGVGDGRRRDLARRPLRRGT